MNNNVIKVAKEIPANAKILLVDVEHTCLEGTDYEWSPKVFGRFDNQIDVMAEKVKDLVTKGHEVYAIVDEKSGGKLFGPLEGLPILPRWGILNLPVLEDDIDPAKIYHLNPAITEKFTKDDVIVVAGIFREQHVLSVVRLLSYHGYNAVLSLDDDICLSVDMVCYEDLDITVEGNCEKANLKIEGNMNNVIKVTEEIPTNAKILLVNIEAGCLEDTDYEWDPKVIETVDNRIERMGEMAKVLEKKGHTVNIIADIENHAKIFESFRGLPILPPWGILNPSAHEDEVDPAKIYHLERTIATVYSKDDLVLVGGLGREEHALSLVRLLSYHGYNAVLSLNDDICLPMGTAFSEGGLEISLEENCKKAKLKIEEYEGVF